MDVISCISHIQLSMNLLCTLKPQWKNPTVGKCTKWGVAKILWLNIFIFRLTFTFVHDFLTSGSASWWQNVPQCAKCSWHSRRNRSNRSRSRSTLNIIKPAGFSRIKKIPYQAPPIQLGPRKCTFWKKAFLGLEY